jgi:hypothetical protein
MSNPGGPMWGGLPGTGGRPQRGPGNGGGVGNASGETSNESKVETTTDKNSNPVLEALKANILPQKEVTDPITGLLYFQIEGKKIKPKSLELHYKTPSGRLAMRFRTT